jgi:hypothetical protein
VPGWDDPIEKWADEAAVNLMLASMEQREALLRGEDLERARRIYADAQTATMTACVTPDGGPDTKRILGLIRSLAYSGAMGFGMYARQKGDSFEAVMQQWSWFQALSPEEYERELKRLLDEDAETGGSAGGR